MIESIFFEIGQLKWVVTVNVVVTLFVCLFFVLKASHFNWKRRNFLYFAYFYNLTIKEVFSLSFILEIALFVLTSAIYPKRIFVGYLIVFGILNICLLISSMDITLTLKSLLTCFANYVLLYIQSQLYLFYSTIDSSFVIMAMIVSLGIFNVLVGIYQALTSYEAITKKRYLNA